MSMYNFRTRFRSLASQGTLASLASADGLASEGSLASQGSLASEGSPARQASLASLASEGSLVSQASLTSQIRHQTQAPRARRRVQLRGGQETGAEPRPGRPEHRFGEVKRGTNSLPVASERCLCSRHRLTAVPNSDLANFSHPDRP